MTEKISWKQTTLQTLEEISTAVQTMSLMVSASSQANVNLSSQHASFDAGISALRPSLKLGRSITGELARRKLNLELAFSPAYVEHLLNLDRLIQSLKHNGPMFSFELRKPIRLWTIRD